MLTSSERNWIAARSLIAAGFMATLLHHVHGDDAKGEALVRAQAEAAFQEQRALDTFNVCAQMIDGRPRDTVRSFGEMNK